MSAVSLRLPKSLYASMLKLARVDICRGFDWRIMLTLLVKISVMIVMNYLYLSIFLSQGANVSLIQFLLGMFKIGWSDLMYLIGKRLIKSMSSWYWFSKIQHVREQVQYGHIAMHHHLTIR